MSGSQGERLVVIELDPAGGSVTVDGSVVVASAGDGLYELAIATVAEQIAGPAGHPVRAVAIEPNSETSMLIAPDGEVSDVQTRELVVDTAVFFADPEVKEGEPAPVEPTAPAASSTSTASTAPTSSAEEQRGDPGPSSRRAPRAPGRRVRGGLLAAAVLVVAAEVVALGLSLAGSDDEESEAQGTTPSPGATSVEPTEPAVVPQLPVTGEVLEVRPELTVRAVGGVERARLAITSSELPVRATVELQGINADGAKVGKPVRRNVRLSAEGQVLVVSGLEAATYTWRVSVRDAEPATGRVRVADAPSAPETSISEPEPSPEVDTTPSTETPSTGGNDNGGGGSTGGDTGGNGGGGGGGSGPSGPVDPNEGSDDPNGPVG